MKVMLVYHNNLTYLIKVSRLNLSPDNCVRSILCKGDEVDIVNKAKILLKERNAIKTSFSNDEGNILELKWNWGSGSKDRIIVTSRQNQFEKD